MTEQLHANGYRVWVWLCEQNWRILQDLKRSCISNPDRANVEQLVAALPKEEMLARADQLFKDDYEKTIKTTGASGIMVAILGGRDAEAVSKLLRVEMKKSTRSRRSFF